MLFHNVNNSINLHSIIKKAHIKYSTAKHKKSTIQSFIHFHKYEILTPRPQSLGVALHDIHSPWMQQERCRKCSTILDKAKEGKELLKQYQELAKSHQGKPKE